MKLVNQLQWVLLFLVAISSCDKPDKNINYRYEMRSFVEKISSYSKSIQPNFMIIPQNGQELITNDGTASATIESKYLQAIDGQAREDIFYGYDADNRATPTDITNQWIAQLDVLKASGKKVLCIDYCQGANMDNAYTLSNNKNYISFSADQRNLNNIPSHAINHENDSDIHTLNEAKNFLYLINPEKYTTKSELIAAINQTSYDLIVLDLFFNNEAFTAGEINSLKLKLNGGKRLVIGYMSIGEAEDYRYYWQKKWKTQQPLWLDKVNPAWKGNYKVKYWNEDWQAIITGNDNSYCKKMIDASFDGVYLDIIDAFDYYENK
jgi:cysteinyl-tRNA synthetase, unknown class